MVQGAYLVHLCRVRTSTKNTMALFDARDLRASYNGMTRQLFDSRNFSDTFEYRLAEARATTELETISKSFASWKTYDVFLSHSFRDAIVILQLYKQLEGSGLSVYVDWINDPLLDRGNVTPKTANILRERIKASKSLFLAHSSNSLQSHWVQWELGYADGEKQGRVAILPIEDVGTTANFHRQEYLGLYPYIDIASSKLFVNGSSTNYKHLPVWLSMSNPRELVLS